MIKGAGGRLKRRDVFLLAGGEKPKLWGGSREGE